MFGSYSNCARPCGTVDPQGVKGCSHGWRVPRSGTQNPWKGIFLIVLAPAGRTGRVVTIPRVPFAFGELHPWLQPSAPSGPNIGGFLQSRSGIFVSSITIPDPFNFLKPCEASVRRSRCRPAIGSPHSGSPQRSYRQGPQAPSRVARSNGGQFWEHNTYSTP